MEPAYNRRLQLFVVAKTLTGGQEFLECKKTAKLLGKQDQSCRGLIRNSKTKFHRNADCASSRMQSCLLHGNFEDPLKAALHQRGTICLLSVMFHIPCDPTKLTMNFNRCNTLCIQELYQRPNVAGGGRRNTSFHFGPLLPRYWY
ncbi:hypothetical protein TNCV_4188801, partial [Trichonephila clavipes]